MEKFSAIINEATRGGAIIVIPFDVKKKYGKARVPIKATFDGEPYQGSIVSMGGRFILGIKKDIRKKINKDVGDKIEVTLEEDTLPRAVEVPEIFKTQLEQHPESLKIFNKLSYTHQKEHVQHILEAKRDETKIRRVERTIDKLLSSDK